MNPFNNIRISESNTYISTVHSEERSLFSKLGLKPDKLSTFVNLFAAQLNQGQGIIGLLEQKGITETVGTQTFQWNVNVTSGHTKPYLVQDSSMSPFNSLPDNTIIAKSDYPEFSLSFDMDNIQYGDILNPGTVDTVYQIRCVSQQPARAGIGWVYKFQMFGDRLFGIPKGLFNSGRPWMKLANFSEELSTGGSSGWVSTPIVFENSLTKYRVLSKISGQAKNLVSNIVFELDGKKEATWVSIVEKAFIMEHYRSMSGAIWYSNKNSQIRGENQGIIIAGSGLFEQLRDCNNVRYSNLSYEFLRDVLTRYYISRIDPTANRNVVAVTGELGLTLFHEAIKDFVKRDVVQLYSGNSRVGFVEPVKSDYHKNAWSAGYQYTMARFPNNVTMTLVHEPAFDDLSRNFELDAVSGLPRRSGSFYIFNLDNPNDTNFGGKNVVLVKRKDGMKSAVTKGITDTSESNMFSGMKMVSHSGEFDTYHCINQVGVAITDPSKVLVLELNRGTTYNSLFNGI
jgi:hypothetical protein